jgi:2-polyprenyl-6-methoxyphenol hydroxylase-like FAD-dependent oxidoreductase
MEEDVALASETGIVIVGAGPTGLSLAASLAARDVPFVLVERLTAPAETSRAAAVHARTLEVLEILGVSDEMIASGRTIPSVTLRNGEQTLLRVGLDDLPTRYRFVLALPQNETEAILTRRLHQLGGRVERGQEVVAVVQDGAGVEVTLRDQAGSMVAVRARYVVGADGYHSIVRQASGIRFTAGTYAETFVLADVHLDWPLPSDEIQLFLAHHGLLLVVPFGDRRFRVVATEAEASASPSIGDVQALLDSRGPHASAAVVRDMIWSSRFHVHHGVAEHFRRGRIFLAGDAAHVHSPAGGQGMNIGIQDSLVLAEGLAAVMSGQQPDQHLDLYEKARRPVAEKVVTMTDQMTRMATLTNPVGQRLRDIGLMAAGHLPTLRHKIATRMAELDL